MWSNLPDDVVRLIVQQYLAGLRARMALAALKRKTTKDVSRGVWLELENEEYGWWLIEVSEGLERGRFFFANNFERFSTYYETFKLALWNDGKVDRAAQSP